MKQPLTLPILVIALMLLSIFIPPGCTYNSAVIEPPPPPIDTNIVSFSEDIIPIFNEACNQSGCHSRGGIAPDLTPANAYDDLWGGGYIDTLLPDESELLQWMLGNRGLPMPTDGSEPEYNTKVFNWINQGAQNN